MQGVQDDTTPSGLGSYKMPLGTLGIPYGDVSTVIPNMEIKHRVTTAVLGWLMAPYQGHPTSKFTSQERTTHQGSFLPRAVHIESYISHLLRQCTDVQTHFSPLVFNFMFSWFGE